MARKRHPKEIQRLLDELERIRQARRQRPPDEVLEEFKGRGLENLTFEDPLTGERRSVWDEVERYWRFGGGEWQVPLPPNFFKEIEKLEREGNYEEARAFQQRTLDKLIVRHFQEKPHLLRAFVSRADLFWYRTAWIAARFWTDNEAVYRWVIDLIPRALRGLSPPTPIISKEDLTQEASAALAKALVGIVPQIRGKITAYLSKTVRNAAITHLRKFPRGQSLDQEAYPEGKETRKDLLQDETALEDLRLALDRIVASHELKRLKDHLTQIEWLLLTHRITPRAELAAFLRVSERQIYRYYADLIEKAQKVLGRR